MTPFKNFEPRGVIPACLLPFNVDFSIDEKSYRKHLSDVAAVKGISAITINAHATEVASCTFEEQQRIMDITMDQIGTRVPVVHGIYSDGSLEAARIARMAQSAGASCLLVFPPNPFTLGGQSRPEMALTHIKTIADSCDLPLIIFQYPLASGQGYPLETLVKMAEEVPNFRAIKDWCANPMLHEKQIRVLQHLPRPINVLTTHSTWLLSSLVLGCNGLLSGSGSVIADLQVALWEAVQANDLKRAKEINDRIHPTVEVFYADPFVDMHNRMKEALHILGRIPKPQVRPPLVKPTAGEIERISAAMDKAGLCQEGALGLVS
jgi:4-hydroxy-tetrahydrodipicolinate synthase